MATTPHLRQPVATDEECISIIGMAGAGKSTVGKTLARVLSWAFMDSDHIIEAHYGTRLQDVADSMSKEEFLDMEGTIISRIGARRTVIATGGSVVYRQHAVNHLKSLGPVVYLDVSLPLILERISRNPERGLAIAPGQTVEDLYNERKALYEAAADFTVCCDCLLPDDCALTIQRLVQQQSIMKKPARRGKGLGVFARLADLYERMAAAYAHTASAAGLTCEGCQQNCCTSFFQHHTYIEWTYLWRGMNDLPAQTRETYLERARDVVRQYQSALSMGVQPTAMCPLNDNGLCGVYKHRLMICRMHGTRNTMVLPNGDKRVFTGCYRFADNVKGMPDERVPALDRTELYKELVQLEMAYVGARLRVLPRVNLTLAEMLVQGPPSIK